MVQLSNILYKKSRKYMRAGFRDFLKIYVQAGAGGNGLPKYGGVGGKGGDVIAVAKENISLEDVYKANKKNQYLAKNGSHSLSSSILGGPGEDLKFDVPVGVKFITDELQKHLGDLNNEGEELILAKGGTGGHSENGFLGTKGQAYPIRLDLKLIADIGLVGFPNAGKSTIMTKLSEAKPKIASYPFTTIRPHIGKIMYKDFRQISIADLPGLIEGAHLNRGMGHEFLKHIERTKLLLMMVDINGFQLGPRYPHRSCLDTIVLLTKELELYNEELLDKPSLLLLNKMDTEGALQKFQEIKNPLKNFSDFIQEYPKDMRPKRLLKFCDIIPISAKERPRDIELIKFQLRNFLDVLSELEQGNEEQDSESLRESLRERGPNLL